MLSLLRLLRFKMFKVAKHYDSATSTVVLAPSGETGIQNYCLHERYGSRSAKAKDLQQKAPVSRG
jgi:hypothetical protein